MPRPRWLAGGVPGRVARRLAPAAAVVIGMAAAWTAVAVVGAAEIPWWVAALGGALFGLGVCCFAVSVWWWAGHEPF